MSRRMSEKRPTVRQIESALTTLMWLFENTEDGGDRDEISHVRHMLQNELDARGA